ncbi:MAG: ATP-binding protein [Ahrensia sp.]
MKSGVSGVLGVRFKRLKRTLSSTVALLPVLTVGAAAQDQESAMIEVFGRPFHLVDLAQFGFFAAAMTAALAASLVLMRERGRLAKGNEQLRSKLNTATTRLNQLEALATAEGQAALIWTGPDPRGELLGRLEKGCGAPDQRASFAAFGRWLEPLSAARLEQAISDLRSDGKPFTDVFETATGMPIDVQGRTSADSAIVRFANIAGERADYQRLRSNYAQVHDTLETFQNLLDQIDSPVWLRESSSRLAWANKAYLDAVEKDALSPSYDRSAELFGGQSLAAMEQRVQSDGSYVEELSTVVRGDRMLYHTSVAKGPYGSAGIAEDRSEVDLVRKRLSKTIRSHEETLDRLTTAVAMFDENQRLKFYNQAFKQLWGFETSLLESEPDISLLLTHLRTEGKLPEQPDWQNWKNGLLSAYRAIEPAEHIWYLPDSRTLRLIATPHAQSGLTWVFENLTDHIDLESRYKTLLRVQTESLDYLSEGVAVFAADGQLALSNPAFAKFWGIKPAIAKQPVHISAIRAQFDADTDEYSMWSEFAGIVTGFSDERANEAGRFDRGDKVLSWSAVPLPNGQTMLTFVDMTGPEQIERALRDRNEALERAADIKDRFIQHVSYELRSPLTNIMGFTELLKMPNTGALNDAQSEYVSHIEASSASLLAVTNDILDLASVDAGIMTLDWEEVDVADAMHAAAGTVKELFDEHEIELLVRVDKDAGRIFADPQRLHQMLVNVLKNAAAFAPEGSSVPFSCVRSSDADHAGITLSVRDKGPGIPDDVLDQVFERFHTIPNGRARGAGLGLSIVKSFARLHDGDVEIHSSAETGTMVKLFLPDAPAHLRVAAQ